MKQLNILLSLITSTILFANMASAQTIEIMKAEPINHEEIHAAVKLQLQDTMALSKATVSNKDLPINTLLVKNSQQGKSKTVTIANISYSAE